MNCCDAAGNCTNGPDCPVRKQRIEAVNKAYVERGMVTDPNPYEDVFGTFKALVVVLAVCIAVTLLSYVVWGKL
jgi:hypothetical protein